LVARNFRRRSDAKTTTLHAGPRKITGDKEGFGKASNEPVFTKIDFTLELSSQRIAKLND
jgi:hypothetical protein